MDEDEGERSKRERETKVGSRIARKGWRKERETDEVKKGGRILLRERNMVNTITFQL